MLDDRAAREEPSGNIPRIKGLMLGGAFLRPSAMRVCSWSARLAVITVTVRPSHGWFSPSHHDLRAAGGEGTFACQKVPPRDFTNVN